jgi:hypothetical protein
MYSSTHSLTSALDGGEWSASRPGRLTHRERAPGTYCLGSRVGPRAVVDAVVKGKIPSPRRESNPKTPPFSLRHIWTMDLFMMKFSWAVSRVKWLSGENTNVSKTISVLVLRVRLVPWARGQRWSSKRWCSHRSTSGPADSPRKHRTQSPGKQQISLQWICLFPSRV